MGVPRNQVSKSVPKMEISLVSNAAHISGKMRTEN